MKVDVHFWNATPKVHICIVYFCIVRYPVHETKKLIASLIILQSCVY
jgi:hypothetical protein